MEHYVTLFDSTYLPQGIALHNSMQKVVKEYLLWILCVDKATYKILSKLNLPNVTLLELDKLETADLLEVKPKRTKAEYCWTLTPFAIKFVFENSNIVKRVTYIDADIWFRKSPNLIFEEFAITGKPVLITDHSYSPEYDQSENSGQYCVQFLTIEKNRGEKVLNDWMEKCIEWCYARVENGKFGDQKYLDDWPLKFKNDVHVMQNKEWALAPWNIDRLPHGHSIFYHFHGLKIVSEKRVVYGPYSIPECVEKYIYHPYLIDLRSAVNIMAEYSFIYVVKPNKSIIYIELMAIFKKIIISLKRYVKLQSRYF